MKRVEVTFRGISPYSQSKPILAEKLPKESSRDYETRTWRNRMHVDDETGEVFIPPMAFKNAIAGAAKYLSMPIPGKGKATYTKHFEAGVMVTDPVYLGIKKDEVPGEDLFVPSDGKRGGGSRVWKTFPLIRNWGGVVVFYVVDDTITKEVFEKVARETGKFIGLGRFRPRNNGYYGRFVIEKFEWTEENF